MDERVFEIILAIIPIIGAILTAYVIPLIKENINNEKLAKYKYWASMAVKAAEMIWTESGKGQDKKEYVVNYLNKLFNSKKTVLTKEQIEVLIEAAVKEMKEVEGNI